MGPWGLSPGHHYLNTFIPWFLGHHSRDLDQFKNCGTASAGQGAKVKTRLGDDTSYFLPGDHVAGPMVCRSRGGAVTSSRSPSLLPAVL